jgi:hypothetical protein
VAIVLVAAAGVFLVHGRASSQPLPPAPPTLQASAVPYLASHAKAATSASLAKDAGIASLEQTLDRMGFVVGSQRTFQGFTKRKLELVVSRSLEFRTAAEAAGYARYVRTHAGDFVGQVPTVTALASAGRTGAMIRAPLCSCHMAQPDLVAVVSKGTRVTWLEINGPAAKPDQLVSLLRRAP